MQNPAFFGSRRDQPAPVHLRTSQAQTAENRVSCIEWPSYDERDNDKRMAPTRWTGDPETFPLTTCTANKAAIAPEDS